MRPLVLPFSTDDLDGIDESVAGHLRIAQFTGELGQVVTAPNSTRPTLLTGCGARADLDVTALRLAAAAAGRAWSHVEAAEVDLSSIGADLLPAQDRDRAFAEGLVLGAYRFDAHRTTTPRWTPPVWTPTVGGPGWDAGLAVAAAVCRVRDVVNEPANVLTPSALAAHCVQVGADTGLTVTVRDEEWLQDNGAGGILAIGRGSVERPLMLEFGFGDPTRPVDLCLVGKGVTFDTGGLSLKGAEEMITMHSDMAAVPTILHAMTFLAQVAPNLHVRAFCPVVENMPGPHSTRPGDVVTARNGKTIEVLNLDFEGRTIMSDALSFAGELEPALIVDLATLTYGAQLALGPRMAALFGTDDATTAVTAAATRAGEPVWRLPIQEYLMPTIRSRVADVKNYPYQPMVRATTAAMFLREFIPEDTPWAHLDIAGPAWSTDAHELTTEGGTGFGMRLLVELFRSLGD
ncbi:leucyl aminopeptidase family protein [Kineococcus sp. SYSU DK003]|uniref:leucyl aminopeptidase family protein n=1 Tax=Kineococcus sp. SYSU DK003 TaxID=3383124 RepID=UPI003D7DC3C5